MNPSDQPPPWPPTTEPALSAAATNGVLTETHTLDIKQELPQGPSGTRGIAKDIAAFSLDGGTIVIGVDETTSPPSLTPVPLDGLAERIEQIAATAVDEPALITTTVIESQRNPALGYVLVSVPASPRAPSWPMASTTVAATKRTEYCRTPKCSASMSANSLAAKALSRRHTNISLRSAKSARMSHLR